MVNHEHHREGGRHGEEAGERRAEGRRRSALKVGKGYGEGTIDAINEGGWVTIRTKRRPLRGPTRRERRAGGVTAHGPPRGAEYVTQRTGHRRGLDRGPSSLRHDAFGGSAPQPLTLAEVENLAGYLYASGLFGKLDKVAVVSKVLLGQALGFAPAESLVVLHSVPGKVPSISALAVAAAFDLHPRYDYEVVRADAAGQEVEFFERGKRNGRWRSAGRVSFTLEDAKRAGLLGKDNYKAYPRTCCSRGP